MFQIFSWATVCTFLVAQGWSLLAATEGKCRDLIQRRLLGPCNYPGPCNQDDASTGRFHRFFESDGDMSTLTKCFPLENFVATINESLDTGNYLLDNATVTATSCNKRRRHSKDKESKAKDPRISSNRNQRNPGKKQMKLLKDLLQIVTFAHYVDSYSRSLERCTENREVERRLQDLEVKMMNIACQMSHILDDRTIKYIKTATIAIPQDLCDAKKNRTQHTDRLRMIVCLLSGLKNAYNGQQACK